MVQEGEGVEAEREWYMNMGARKVREEDERRRGRGRVRSLIHLSDFILGLSLSPVFTPASHFDPTPWVCHYCVKSRLYTGFSFFSFQTRTWHCFQGVPWLISSVPCVHHYLFGSYCNPCTRFLYLTSSVPCVHHYWFGLYCILVLAYFIFFSRHAGTSKVLLGVQLSTHFTFLPRKVPFVYGVSCCHHGWSNLS